MTLLCMTGDVTYQDEDSLDDDIQFRIVPALCQQPF